MAAPSVAYPVFWEHDARAIRDRRLSIASGGDHAWAPSSLSPLRARSIQARCSRW
ncbi:hypothetical protein FHT13_000641 [Xanthomonas arboricola]|nr:hypothetical protein [Xanthomonas arboricola]